MKVGGVFEGIIGDDNDFESSKNVVRRQESEVRMLRHSYAWIQECLYSPANREGNNYRYCD